MIDLEQCKKDLTYLTAEQWITKYSTRLIEQVETNVVEIRREAEITDDQPYEGSPLQKIHTLQEQLKLAEARIKELEKELKMDW